MDTGRDGWRWGFDHINMYSISSHLDLDGHLSNDVLTRWNMYVLIKANFFVWRLGLNRLPTRCNLDKCDITLESILCPCCGDTFEDANNLFF